MDEQPADPMSELDSELSALLPEDPDEVANVAAENERDHLITLLEHAAEEIGRSPTTTEFDRLDIGVSSRAVAAAFGSWNDAKEAAGLETWEVGHGPSYVDIDVEYFETIDAPEPAYWLGTLLAASTLREQDGGLALVIGRTEEKRYFVDAFADAVGSDYAIGTYENSTSATSQAQTLISNQRFIDHLLDAGYPAVGTDAERFPRIDESLRPAFVRGFLESSGYFSTQGWNVRVETEAQGRTLQRWFEDFGAERPTVGETKAGEVKVRVANVFDVKAVFETCWPDGLDTTPSFREYPQKVLDHLESEYPYPENVEYLTES